MSGSRSRSSERGRGKLPTATARGDGLGGGGGPARPSPWPLLLGGAVFVNIGAVLVAADAFAFATRHVGAIGEMGVARYVLGGAVILAGVVVIALGMRRAMAHQPGLWQPPAWLPQPLAGFAQWLHWISVYQWRAIDAETPRPADPPGAPLRLFEPAILVILVTVAVSLTLQEYVGDRGWFHRWFGFEPTDEYRELRSFAWWSGWRVLGYVVLPILVLWFLPRHRVRDYYVAPVGFFRHMPVYTFLFLLILPAVVLASTTESFRHTYPFYKLANRSTFDLAAWELLYAVQFLSLEFFFRGVMLEGLRGRLGSNAIFVMIVPYCMIHYGKPLAETMGAIGAGVILGTLAMRTRSIWGGVLIHVAVALTMDVLALRACPPPGRPCGF